MQHPRFNASQSKGEMKHQGDLNENFENLSEHPEKQGDHVLALGMTINHCMRYEKYLRMKGSGRPGPKTLCAIERMRGSWMKVSGRCFDQKNEKSL